MKRVILIGLLFIAATSYGQNIVYKSDYEKAIERMGTVYSVSSQDVGEYSIRNQAKTSAKAKCTLNTFECADSNQRIQDFVLQVGSGMFAREVHLNTREIDALIAAANKIKANGKLRYITETANLRLRGSFEKGVENKIALDFTAEGSSPGDFVFVTWGYIAHDELIKLLEQTKEMAD